MPDDLVNLGFVPADKLSELRASGITVGIAKMLRIAAVLVAGATALQAPRQPLSTAPSWLQAATLAQPPAASKELLPRERYVSPGA